MKSPYITVDIGTVQSNICMIHLLQPKKYSAKYFVERLDTVTAKELSDGITDQSGNGILVKMMAKDEWTCIRYVIYYHINSELTELAIKKIRYCIKEFV